MGTKYRPAAMELCFSCATAPLNSSELKPWFLDMWQNNFLGESALEPEVCIAIGAPAQAGETGLLVLFLSS